MNINKILKSMELSNLSYFGIRGDDIEKEVGQELDPSFDWDYENDCQSTEKLNGTCATAIPYLYFDGENEDIESLKETIEFHKKNYIGYKNMYVIGGSGSEYGMDEREIIIENAEVIAVI